MCSKALRFENPLAMIMNWHDDDHCVKILKLTLTWHISVLSKMDKGIVHGVISLTKLSVSS